MLLDSLRKHSRSFIIYVLFGIIIAVFVVNFGPQSQGCGAASSGTAAKVEGRDISLKLFSFALSAARIRSRQLPEDQMIPLRGMVMDRLLERELLAEDAMNLGLRIPEKSIDDMFFKGRYLALGQPQSLKDREDDWQFDYSHFSRMVKYLWQMTVKKFKQEQRRELLAEKMRQLLRASIKVSSDEVKADFTQRNTLIALRYVRFTPGEFNSQVKADPAKVKAYLAANTKKVKEFYEENKTAYQKLPKQVRLQIIQINSMDTAKEKAAAALARIKGGEAFSRVATETSDDQAHKGTGGVLGWRNADSPGIGDNASKALAKLKEGQVSEVVEDKDRLTIVKLLSRREGDLSLAQAQEDIAEEIYRSSQTVELAKKTAMSYIKRARAGEKLVALFSGEDDLSGKDDAEDKADGEGKDGVDGASPAKKPAPAPAKFKLQSTAAFPRSARNLIPGVGISKELMTSIFKMKQGEVAERPFVVDKMVYLVAAKEKTDPDWKDWGKRKDDLIEDYQTQKWIQVMQDYSYKRCKAALKDKRLVVNARALVTPGYVHPKGKPPLPGHPTCSSLKSDKSMM